MQNAERAPNYEVEARCFYCGKIRYYHSMKIRSILGGPTKVWVCNDKYINDCN